MIKFEDGVLTCRGINLTDSKGDIVVTLRGDDHNSGVWIENQKTGHMMFLSANDKYTGVGIYEKKGDAIARVGLGLNADGTVIHSGSQETRHEQLDLAPVP